MRAKVLPSNATVPPAAFSALDLFPFSTWCEPGDCILPCIAKFGFVPYAAAILTLFYTAAALITFAKRHGITWSEQSFSSVWDVAWHVPNIFMCVPTSLSSLQTSWRLLGQSDFERFGPLNTVADLEVTECCIWFGTYLALDMILMMIHRFGREIFG